MKTEQLVDLLATQAGPAPRHMVQMRLGTAVLLGIGASLACAVLLLGLNPGLRDLGAALAVKALYVCSVLVAAAALADRLARPGAATRREGLALTAVVVLMGFTALSAVLRAPAATGLDMLLGRSWAQCPWRVAALSVPALMAALWAMRGLAPTRPRWAGAAAGLMAGGAGAIGYSLYCPEVSPLFVLVWYSIGMLIPAGLGAAIGPRVLRW